MQTDRGVISGVFIGFIGLIGFWLLLLNDYQFNTMI